MAARRSFSRSVGKFNPEVVAKPVAILTAFRGETSLVDNRKANVNLANDLVTLNLGFYPVKGAGQEERLWFFGFSHYVVPTGEESFIVQPREETEEKDFESFIQSLLHKYSQFAAMMKLPSSPQAFLLYADGNRLKVGSSVGPTTEQDTYFTQLYGGRRADSRMLRSWELFGERNIFKRFINWWYGRSFMNRPVDRSRIGQRFSIKNIPTEEE
ncbi:MAG TPA: hypothetical protein VG097_17360 [Gemmata sp.]|jgi:hypothetical protein|nr:hypothetical protein [Gemmata sp.]